MKITLPFITVNPLNRHEHWTARSKRHGRHRAGTFYALKAEKAPHTLPCTVTITRVAPRALDRHDGLPASMKPIVDGIADWLLINDNDPRLTILYAQRKGEPKECAVEVEIE